MLLEPRIDVVPGGATAQDQRVQPAEQPQRRVPGRIGTDEPINERIVRKPPAELRVER